MKEISKIDWEEILTFTVKHGMANERYALGNVVRILAECKGKEDYSDELMKCIILLRKEYKRITQKQSDGQIQKDG